MYRINYPQGKPIGDGEPKSLALRYYGAKHIKYEHEGTSDDRLTDAIMAIMLAEAKLSPKIFGSFLGGRIEEFVDVRLAN